MVSSPLNDWSWFTAPPRVHGGHPKGDPQTPTRWPDINNDPGRNRRILLYPHVALPHVIVVVLESILFVLGLLDVFGPI